MHLQIIKNANCLFATFLNLPSFTTQLSRIINNFLRLQSIVPLILQQLATALLQEDTTDPPPPLLSPYHFIRSGMDVLLLWGRYRLQAIKSPHLATVSYNYLMDLITHPFGVSLRFLFFTEIENLSRFRNSNPRCSAGCATSELHTISSDIHSSNIALFHFLKRRKPASRVESRFISLYLHSHKSDYIGLFCVLTTQNQLKGQSYEIVMWFVWYNKYKYVFWGQRRGFKHISVISSILYNSCTNTVSI